MSKSTSLSTIIGDQIEKFSQPKNPIYRVDFVESKVEYDEGDPDIITQVFSITCELPPLNEEDLQQKEKFEKFKNDKELNKYNNIADNGLGELVKSNEEWEDKICYRFNNFQDKYDSHHYIALMKDNGILHAKLYNRIQKSIESKNNYHCKGKMHTSVLYCCNYSWVFTNMERIG